LEFLLESLEPMIMGDHTPQPLPDTFFGIQLGRVGRLRLEDESSTCGLQKRRDRGSFMLLRSVVDHYQRFVPVVGQLVVQRLML
jgi:hypothetical protein